MVRLHRLRPGSIPFKALTPTERKLLAFARRGPDPLHGGLAESWSAKTWRTVLRRYLVFRAWYERRWGRAVDEPPGVRVTTEVLRAYYDWRKPQVSAVTLAGEFRDIREALRVMCPEANLEVITRVMRRLIA